MEKGQVLNCLNLQGYVKELSPQMTRAQTPLPSVPSLMDESEVNYSHEGLHFNLDDPQKTSRDSWLTFHPLSAQHGPQAHLTTEGHPSKTKQKKFWWTWNKNHNESKVVILLSDDSILCLNHGRLITRERKRCLEQESKRKSHNTDHLHGCWRNESRNNSLYI